MTRPGGAIIMKSLEVRDPYNKQISRQRPWQRVIAMAFLLFLLVEWGSHAMTHAFSPAVLNHTSISADEGCHEDPCQSLILCGDSRRERQQMPNPGHQIAQPNELAGLIADVLLIDLRESPPIPFGTSHTIFRPSSPPLPPPELS